MMLPGVPYTCRPEILLLTAAELCLAGTVAIGPLGRV